MDLSLTILASGYSILRRRAMSRKSVPRESESRGARNATSEAAIGSVSPRVSLDLHNRAYRGRGGGMMGGVTVTPWLIGFGVFDIESACDRKMKSILL